MNTFRQNNIVDVKYEGLPRAWSYSAEVMMPLSKELAIYAQSRAAMFYQTVLRKLVNPDTAYIIEAKEYVKRHKSVLLHYRWGWKYYLSALVLCLGYPLWALIFRRIK